MLDRLGFSGHRRFTVSAPICTCDLAFPSSLRQLLSRDERKKRKKRRHVANERRGKKSGRETFKIDVHAQRNRLKFEISKNEGKRSPIELSSFPVLNFIWFLFGLEFFEFPVIVRRRFYFIRYFRHLFAIRGTVYFKNEWFHCLLFRFAKKMVILIPKSQISDYDGYVDRGNKIWFKYGRPFFYFINTNIQS